MTSMNISISEPPELESESSVSCWLKRTHSTLITTSRKKKQTTLKEAWYCARILLFSSTLLTSRTILKNSTNSKRSISPELSLSTSAMILATVACFTPRPQRRSALPSSLRLIQPEPSSSVSTNASTSMSVGRSCLVTPASSEIQSRTRLSMTGSSSISRSTLGALLLVPSSSTGESQAWPMSSHVGAAESCERGLANCSVRRVPSASAASSFRRAARTRSKREASWLRSSPSGCFVRGTCIAFAAA
mmetsp:Transcript_86471/g.245195  ORF Transcript_86471/g.245195 Transcript_86471/m.245195 type:complete len:247 (-) Transcript_86471:622-1362(-)